MVSKEQGEKNPRCWASLELDSVKMPTTIERKEEQVNVKIRIQYMIIKFERLPSDFGNAEVKGWNRKSFRIGFRNNS